MRYTPMRYTPMSYTPIRYTPMRCTPVRYTPMRCMPMRCMPMRCTPTMHTPMKVFARTLRVRTPSHICPSSSYGFGVVTYGFQSSLWCPKGYYLGRCTVCLGTSAHRPCFDPSVCLSPEILTPPHISCRTPNPALLPNAHDEYQRA
jgi:hypothetical protein